jgi:hypothetical protein
MEAKFGNTLDSDDLKETDDSFSSAQIKKLHKE